MSDPIYALLIGAGFYFPNITETGTTYPSLQGCVRDIMRVEEELLIGRLQVPRDRILKLKASDTGKDQPDEPHEQWPTYDNIVAKFQELIDMATPPDFNAALQFAQESCQPLIAAQRELAAKAGKKKRDITLTIVPEEILTEAKALAGDRVVGFGERYELPLPLSFYLYGTAAIVAMTFLVVALFVRRVTTPRRYSRLVVRSTGAIVPHLAISHAIKFVSLVLFVVTVAAGLAGEQSPYRNIAPTMVWRSTLASSCAASTRVAWRITPSMRSSAEDQSTSMATTPRTWPLRATIASATRTRGCPRRFTSTGPTKVPASASAAARNHASPATRAGSEANTSSLLAATRFPWRS